MTDGSPVQAEPVLSARSLTKEFITKGDGAFIKRKKRFGAVNDISFDVPTGSTFAIVGESGSGSPRQFALSRSCSK